MESDEKYILSRFGNKNHFAVPEGYFEHLQDDILTSVAMLEEEKTVETCPKEDKPKIIPLRSRMLRYAAACVGIMVAGAVTWTAFTPSAPQQDPTLAAKDNKPQTETTDNSTATLSAHDTPAHHSVSDEMADYSMLDNEDIYSLLASN